MVRKLSMIHAALQEKSKVPSASKRMWTLRLRYLPNYPSYWLGNYGKENDRTSWALGTILTTDLCLHKSLLVLQWACRLFISHSSQHFSSFLFWRYSYWIYHGFGLQSMLIHSSIVLPVLLLFSALEASQNLSSVTLERKIFSELENLFCQLTL